MTAFDVKQKIVIGSIAEKHEVKATINEKKQSKGECLLKNNLGPLMSLGNCFTGTFAISYMLERL